MKCPKCKTENKGNAYFCHNCSHQFKTKINGWAVSFAVQFVVTAIFAIYFYDKLNSHSAIVMQPETTVTSEKTEPIPVKNIYTVTIPTTLSLEVGQPEYLTYTITPQKDINQKVTWSSNNSKIATVDPSGMVTAITEGNAVITASIGDIVSNTCNVSISPDIIDVLIIQASQRLLTEADIRGLSYQQLRFLRNGIFARYGYIFQWDTSDDLRAYFSKKPWYESKYENISYVSSLLNTNETKNVKFIEKLAPPKK